MKVHLLFEIEVPEIRVAVDGSVGLAVAGAMQRALEAIREDHGLKVRLIRAEEIDSIPPKEVLEGVEEEPR